MTWTYSGDPQSSPKDQVRFLCGDTKASEPFLQDEEILFLLNERAGAPKPTAYEACLQILQKLSEEVDVEIGPQNVKASQRFAQYKTFFEERQRLLISTFAAPTWSGDEYSVPKPIFDIGMHDNNEC